MTADAKPAACRWRCVCAYDGGAFDGWQSQTSGNAIQDVIEWRLRDIFKRDVRIHGSGRTDAGVHAHGQVFHFDAPWPHGPEKLRAALQAGLPRAIQIKSARRVAPDFHARFSAKGKIYRYHIFLGQPDPFAASYCWGIDRSLDWRAMRQAARALRGRHDFRVFAAVGGAERENTVRNLRRLDLVRRGRRATLTFEADGFLYKMVRSLVGALVNVGLGKLALADVASLLQSARRPPAVQTAPPQGLFLVKVIY